MFGTQRVNKKFCHCFSGRAPVDFVFKPVSPYLTIMDLKLTVHIPMFVDIDDVTIPENPSTDEWVLDKESRYLKWSVSVI